MARIELRLSPRFTAFLGGAWVLAAAGLALRSSTLLVAGLFMNLVVAFGAVVPRTLGIQARVTVAADSAVEDEPTRLRLQVKNQGRRSHILEWKVELPGPTTAEGTNAGWQYLRAGASEEFPFTGKFHLFGLLRVGPARIRLEDPFGFAALEGPVGRAVDLRVYPRHETLRRPFMQTKQQRTLLGAYEVSQPGNGFEFFALRDYVAGDRPRDVNWKASARAGRVIVNQHQKENDSEVVIFADTRSASGVGRQSGSPFASGCRAAIAVAKTHMGQRDAVRVIAYGRGTHEDRHTGNLRHLQGILDTVVALKPEGDQDLLTTVSRTLPSMRRRSPVLIITPLLGDRSVNEAAALLRSHEFPVYAIVPQPDWGPHRNDTTQSWQTAQQRAVASLRGAGIPTAHLPPDGALEGAVGAMEVAA